MEHQPRARLAVLVAAAACFTVFPASAGEHVPEWATYPIDPNAAPLENQIVALGPLAGDPDLLVFTLWNTAVNENRLGAYLVPTPVDGTGVSFTPDIDVGQLYGIGEICVPTPGEALVPYIRWNPATSTYDVWIAEYDGLGWATAPIAETAIPDVHTATCAMLNDEPFVMALNATDQQVEFFQGTPGAFGTEFDPYCQLTFTDPNDVPLTPWSQGQIPALLPIADPSTTREAWTAWSTVGGDSIVGRVELSLGDATWVQLLEEPLAGLGEVELVSLYTEGTPILWVVDQYPAPATGVLGRLWRIQDIAPAPVVDSINLGMFDPGSDWWCRLDAAAAADRWIYITVDVDPLRVQTSVPPDPIRTPDSSHGFPPGLDGNGTRDSTTDRWSGTLITAGRGSQVLAVLEDVSAIFVDGFETGDTSEW